DQYGLVPLPEPGLQNLVDVNPDAPDIALVDLDLVQVCGGMREPLRRAPVVLPEVGTQPILQRPVDGPGVGVHPDALMAEHRFPAAQIRRHLALVLVVAGIVVDRREIGAPYEPPAATCICQPRLACATPAFW